MRGNLQASAATFFGRQRELEQLRRMLRADTRLVTLCGAGGAGKTRLAQELLRRVAEEQGTGVWFCDASGATDRDDIHRTVAAALGVELGVGAGQQLAEAIASRGPVLLCLDNLEQVVDAAAGVVAEWLGACPELSLVVTSRARLRVAGERVLEVPPLSDHGAELFVDRARQMGTPVTDDESQWVERIVSSLEHHPLAIELAAARTAVLSVSELAQLLPGRWDLLEHRRRDAPERHHSLTATLWWSWELLDAPRRETFARCALFAGAFDRHDVEQVMGDGATDALFSLRDASLVRAKREGDRVLMSMFVPIRDFGRARLGDLELVAPAHFDHARWLLHRCGETERVETIGELIEDAVAVHQWALGDGSKEALLLDAEVLAAVGPYFEARGPVDAQIKRWEACLSALDDREDASAPPVGFVKRARLLRMAGRLEEASRDLGTALDRGAESQLGFEVALEAAHVHYAAGRLTEALAAASTAEERALEMGARERGLAATMLGRLVHSTGRPAEARELHLAAIDHLVGHERHRCLALTALAFTEQDLGDSPHAETCFVEALEAYRRLGNKRDEASVLGYLGNVFRSREHRERAESLYAQALAIFRAQGAPWSEAVFTMDHGILLSLVDDPAASAVFEEALQFADATDNVRCAALIHGHLGVLAADADDIAAAERHFELAAKKLGDDDGQFPAVLAIQRHHLALARARAADGDDILVGSAKAALEAPPAVESEHMRIARKILGRAVLRTAPPEGTLRVARDGSWFAREDKVDLSAHPALGRVLAALATASEPLGLDAVFRAGWPGDRAVAAARKNRVRVAISTLRKRGVPVAFERSSKGYALTTAVVLTPAAPTTRAATAAPTKDQ